MRLEDGLLMALVLLAMTVILFSLYEFAAHWTRLV